METFVEDWGYLGVFLGIIATGLGFPMPEELPVVIGGGLSGTGHALWWIMLPTCIVGVIIGDSCLYLIGRIWGRKLVKSELVRKRLLPPERFASISDNFQHYGIKILLFARMTPGIRAPIFLTAGIVHLPIVRFLLADGIYAIPGVTILFTLGYFFTERVKEMIVTNVETVKSIIILAAVGGVAGYLLYRWLRKPLVVTGSPQEIPRVLEPVERTLESMTSALQAPIPDDAGLEPEPAAAPASGPAEEEVNHGPTG